MTESASPRLRPGLPDLALAIVDQIPAMVAYWDNTQTCRFANEAYLSWFGKSRVDLLGTTMQELLGPIYALNLPYILAALAGQTQHFERRIPTPDGAGHRDSIATYTPDIVGGTVQGFFVHVADTTRLKQREAALQQVIEERDQALAEVQTLRGLLSMCASCKAIRDENGAWKPLESYLSQRTQATISHGLCPVCAHQLYPDIF